MTIANLKKHWIFSLDHCIIAGGFFRDSIYGDQISDIDIYVLPSNKDVFLKQIKSRVATDIHPRGLLRPLTKVTIPSPSEYQSIGRLQISEIIKYKTWHGEKLDIVITPNATGVPDIIENFDYSVNMGGWSKDEGFKCVAGYFYHVWIKHLKPYRQDIHESRAQHMMSKGYKPRV